MATVRSSGSIARPLGAGLMAGAALGLAWMAARRYGRGRADQILDWEQIRSIAVRASAAAGPMSAEERDSVEAGYAQLVRDIAAPVADYTRTGLSLAATEVRALERPEWIDANISNFRELLQPFEQLYRDTVNPASFDLPGVTAVGRLLLSGELGFLLGYLSRRVLGQYDISLLGARATEPGKLYFVEPNIRAVQQHLGLPEREFRVWLALHEATHAHEFEGHPWVREYLNATLQDYLTSMVDVLRDRGDSERIRRGNALAAAAGFVARAADRLSVGGTLLEAIMTPYQRELVSRLQALMCLLEGYSNHVMQMVGRTLLPHFDEIEQRVEARSKQKSAAELLFLRLTGLQMKLDQYRLGTAFVNHVEQARGLAFMNQVWNAPANLPTELEIREPARWVRRMEQVVA